MQPVKSNEVQELLLNLQLFEYLLSFVFLYFTISAFQCKTIFNFVLNLLLLSRVVLVSDNKRKYGDDHDCQK